MFTPRQRRKWKGRGLPRRETGRDREAPPPPLLPPSAAPPSRHGKGEGAGSSPLPAPPPHPLLLPGAAATSHPPVPRPGGSLAAPAACYGRFVEGAEERVDLARPPRGGGEGGPEPVLPGEGRGGVAWPGAGGGSGGGLCPDFRGPSRPSRLPRCPLTSRCLGPISGVVFTEELLPLWMACYRLVQL